MSPVKQRAHFLLGNENSIHICMEILRGTYVSIKEYKTIMN